MERSVGTENAISYGAEPPFAHRDTEPEMYIYLTKGSPKCFGVMGGISLELRYTLIMAKTPPKDEFLGGFAFNQAGAAPVENDPAADDTGPIRVSARLSPQGVRMLIILAVVLLLAVILYVVGGYGFGGVVHSQGHGLSPGERPTVPTGNF